MDCLTLQLAHTQFIKTLDVVSNASSEEDALDAFLDVTPMIVEIAEVYKFTEHPSWKSSIQFLEELGSAENYKVHLNTYMHLLSFIFLDVGFRLFEDDYFKPSEVSA